MSATANSDAVNANANQGGNQQFGSKVPGHQPGPEAHGHQVGQKVGNDAVPEHHIQTLPAGTAPADRTFAPNPQGETPGQGLNPASNVDGGAGRTSASATLVGATSGDVHTGLGQPVQGQSSAELHHDGKSHRAREGGGLQGVGAAHAPTADGPRDGYGHQSGINQHARDDKAA